MKALDSISHKSLWNALEQCGIESQYVSLLERLYTDQIATVLTDKESDVFEKREERNRVTHYPVCSSPSGAEG